MGHDYITSIGEKMSLKKAVIFATQMLAAYLICTGLGAVVIIANKGIAFSESQEFLTSVVLISKLGLLTFAGGLCYSLIESLWKFVVRATKAE